MTNAEANYKYDRAIDLIRRIKTEETHEREIDRHKAFDLAINALEKQTPKKPDNIILCDEFYGGGFKLCYGKCKCGETVAKIYIYCPNCGQKIDWSDTDEN